MQYNKVKKILKLPKGKITIYNQMTYRLTENFSSTQYWSEEKNSIFRMKENN